MEDDHTQDSDKDDHAPPLPRRRRPQPPDADRRARPDHQEVVNVDFAVGVLLAVVAILGSIALHEAGHLIAARSFGVSAPEFGVGFGPRLFRFTPKSGKTTYGLHLLPLGGFVRLAGMYPPPPQGANPEGLAAKGYALQETREGDWIGKRVWQVRTWQKVTIMAAGPAVNLVLAVVGLVVAMCLVGVPTTTAPLGAVSDGSPAAAAGLRPGDLITSVNGESTSGWGDTRAAVRAEAGGMIELEYERDGQARTTTVDATGAELIGVSPSMGYEQMPITRIPAELGHMVASSVQGIIAYPKSVVELAGTTFSEAPRSEESPMSMVGAGDLSGQIAAHEDVPTRTKAFLLFSLFTALNLFLGLFNLVPLTPLDGGHIATAIASSIRRRVAAWRRREDPGQISPAVLTPVTVAATGVFMLAGVVTISADIIEPIRLFN